MTRFIFTVALFAFAFTTVSAVTGARAAENPELSGVARVIDADIIAIGKQRIILWGVDAPERNQTCRLGGREWGCWQAAARNLQTLAEDRNVHCEPYGERDPLGRVFAVCHSGDVDIGQAMVKSGLARAYVKQSDLYAGVEKEAKSAKVGLWQNSAKSVAPWVWRLTKSRSLIR